MRLPQGLKLIVNLYVPCIRLENQHQVFFDADDDDEAVLHRGMEAVTSLAGWFAACAKCSDVLLAAVTYPQISKYLVWDHKAKACKVRQKGFALGRVYFAGPNSNECFYLRLLFHHVACPKSWTDLRRGCDTFKEACILVVLLADDAEWDQFMTEEGGFLLGD